MKQWLCSRNRDFKGSSEVSWTRTDAMIEVRGRQSRGVTGDLKLELWVLTDKLLLTKNESHMQKWSVEKKSGELRQTAALFPPRLRAGSHVTPQGAEPRGTEEESCCCWEKTLPMCVCVCVCVCVCACARACMHVCQPWGVCLAKVRISPCAKTHT